MSYFDDDRMILFFTVRSVLIGLQSIVACGDSRSIELTPISFVAPSAEERVSSALAPLAASPPPRLSSHSESSPFG